MASDTGEFLSCAPKIAPHLKIPRSFCQLKILARRQSQSPGTMHDWRYAMTLQELFGIRLPIIQAPMAGAQGSKLASGVSNAGGLGSLPCAMLTPDGMRAELQAIRAASDQPYNVNFFCHTPPTSQTTREAAWREFLAPYFREFGIDAHAGSGGGSRTPFGAAAADALEPFKPKVVSFHFGLPSADLVTRVKSWGSKVLSSATTVEEAVWLEQRGVDAVIAQGAEAGGHRGIFLSEDLTTQVGTFALLPQVVKAVRVPVIAAGGIADATGVAAAMSRGAQERSRLAHRNDQCVYRPSGTRNHESPHGGIGTHQRGGTGISTRRGRLGAAA